MSNLIISSSLICVCGHLPLQRHPVSPPPAPPGSPEELEKKSEPQGISFHRQLSILVTVGHAPSLKYTGNAHKEGGKETSISY